jgi:hypothetical protein
VTARPAKKTDWVGMESGLKLIECGKIGEVQEFIF